jgi:hypothetical protein
MMNLPQNLTKILKRKIIIFFLYPIFCFGQNVDIKLSCQVSLTYRHSNGIVERDLVKEIYQVYQSNTILLIFASSDSGKLGSVGTSKSPDTISIENESNQNKWHLKTTSKDKSGIVFVTSINIDRNSGNIFYYQNYDFAKLVTEGQGQCQKIDTSKKLF